MSKILKKIKIKTILILAVLLRLVLLPLTYHGDITVIYWWGKFAADFGLRGYYDWLNFGGYGLPDQPMIMIYYVQIIRKIFEFIYLIIWYININIPLFPSKISQWFFLEGNQILLKVPFIFFDILLAIVSINFLKLLKIKNELKLKIIFVFILFYLPIIYNSTLWGSGDSLILSLALLALYRILQKKYFQTTLLLTLSILFKPTLIVWLPIFALIFIKQKPKLKQIFTLTIFFLALIYFISKPFTPIEINPLVWFYQTMTTKILPGCMWQLTSNAFNIWALFFGIVPRLDELLIFPFLSARNLSLIISLILYLWVLFKLIKNYSLKQIIYSLAMFSAITFTFMTRMHERYTFPSLIPLYILSNIDKKYFKFFWILTITHLLNVYNWWWYPNINFLVYILEQDFIIRIISLINVLLVFKLLFINEKNK